MVCSGCIHDNSDFIIQPMYLFYQLQQIFLTMLNVKWRNKNFTIRTHKTNRAFSFGDIYSDTNHKIPPSIYMVSILAYYHLDWFVTRKH